MAVHLVQRSNALSACLGAASEADIVVLLGEGVSAISQAPADRLVYGAATDIRERGLGDRTADTVTPISDDELVQLCADHHPVVSWNQP